MADCLQLFLLLTLIRMPTVKQSQEDILANSIENLDVTEEVEDMEESWNKDQIQDLVTLSGLFYFVYFFVYLLDYVFAFMFFLTVCIFVCLIICLTVGVYVFVCLKVWRNPGTRI